MALLNEEVRRFIGLTSEWETACEPVERGAVRRYAQAIMDDDPIYHSEAATEASRYRGPVAPPLFPTGMFRRPFATPDPLSESAQDPDFDGIVGSTAQGLPELPLKGLALLNGGSEVEFFRYARHGETVRARARYADIRERESAKGAMIFVIIETEYRTGRDELLMRVKKTIIRR